MKRVTETGGTRLSIASSFSAVVVLSSGGTFRPETKLRGADLVLAVQILLLTLRSISCSSPFID